ncbi:MAG: hypothetical protein ACRDL8_10670, partial [Solirubrobacteraceae bacterium]
MARTRAEDMGCAQPAAPELWLAVAPAAEPVATALDEVLATELETVLATEFETVLATEFETVLATELATVPATLDTVVATLGPSSGGLPTELVIRPMVPATAEPAPEIVDDALPAALETTRPG